MGDINVIEILIYIINFAVTVVLLYLLLYRPVSRFLAARRERIAAALSEAEATRAAAEDSLQEAKAELSRTGERAREISHEAIETAAIDAERILANAQAEADLMLSQTREQIKTERHAAQERAASEMVTLAGELASRILSREVGMDDQRGLVEQFFNEAAGQTAEEKPS